MKKIALIGFSNTTIEYFKQHYKSTASEIVFFEDIEELNNSIEKDVSEYILAFCNIGYYQKSVFQDYFPMICFTYKDDKNVDLDKLVSRLHIEDFQNAEDLFLEVLKWTGDFVHFKRFYDHLLEGILIFNEQQKIIYSNYSIENILGYSKKELLYLPLFKLIKNEDHEKHNGHFNKFIEQEKINNLKSFNKDIYGLTKDGKQVFFDINIDKVRLGTKSFYMASIRDISERREARQKLIKSNELLDTHVEELQTAYESLNSHKSKLENKSDELNSSLRYASNIQNIFHTDENKLRQLFNNSFEIFKPQNIVSGDIVWASETHLGNAVAVIDCMGHGVPGAMLSISVIHCLESVSKEGKFYSATSFLAEVVNKYYLSFNNQVSDTFDISICIFDKLSRLVFFQGLKRPLVISRDEEISTLNGLHYDIKEFHHQSKNIDFLKDKVKPIRKGDRLYMFSDGYPDQFGGPKNKKIKISNFRELLRRSSSLPISEQKEELESKLHDWMNYEGNEYEQIDDIAVVGIEI